MATYAELFNLRSDDGLRNRVAVAVIRKAQALLDGAGPTSNEVTWASKALSAPGAEATRLFDYVLAANSAATVTQIQGATDASIQANVDAAVDALIAAGVV
jgi:hypothetical protein